MKQIRNLNEEYDCIGCGRRALSGDVMVLCEEGRLCGRCFKEEVCELGVVELASALGYGVVLI